VQVDDDTPPPRGGIAGRVLAGVVGVLLLAGGAVSTLGVALLAPLGMLGAGMIARAKGRPLSRGAAWAGAVTIAVLAFAVAGTVAVARTPAGTFERMRHDADSARKVAATQPPPPWLERIAPGAAKARQQQQMDSTAARIVGSPAFVIWTMIMGGLLTCFVFGGFAGTVGWGGSTLLYYAARGRWLPRRKRATSLPES
jgi:hypothetical protein